MAEVLFRAKLQREGAQTPWGFRLQGGVEYNKPLTLLKVTDNSIASKCGLHAGDIVVKLAGKSADDMTHKDAQQAIVSAGNVLEIIVERADVTITSTSGKEEDKKNELVNDTGQYIADNSNIIENVSSSGENNSIPIQQHNGPCVLETDCNAGLVDDNSVTNCSFEAREGLNGEIASELQNSSKDNNTNNTKLPETKPPKDKKVTRSPDINKKTLTSKVKEKPEPSDTGQSIHRSSDSLTNSDESDAQNVTTKPVINENSDLNFGKTVLGDNVREKRLNFINWASSSTSSDSDDSVSIRVANRERMLPSPVSTTDSNQDNLSTGHTDSKYPWRRARPENRNKTLHVRSISEPARNTVPEEQIGSSNLPKKSISVANLAQNENVKVKPLKPRTLEAVKEEVDHKNDDLKNKYVSSNKNVSTSQDLPVDYNRGVNDTQSANDSKHQSSEFHNNSLLVNSQQKGIESLKAQETNTTSAIQSISTNTFSSSDSNFEQGIMDINNSDNSNNVQNSNNEPSKEDRKSSNSQYIAPTQEDIYFAAADPDLVGISMPTVKSMVANLNSRLEVIAAEHPKIAQPATPTELGLTFSPKDLSKQEKFLKTNSPSPDITLTLDNKDKGGDEISVDTPLTDNSCNNNNTIEKLESLKVNICSSPSPMSPTQLSPRSTGDRKVRFADPPESSVIEIEPSERRRRKALGPPGERRREDKYPEFYKKKVDDDHQLNLNETELLMSDSYTTVNKEESSNVEDIEPPSVSKIERTEIDVAKSESESISNLKKSLLFSALDDTNIKLPDIGVTTACSVKELADRLDRIERENELSNLKLRSMRMTREEGDKPLVAMDITGRTYSITPAPVSPKEKPPAKSVSDPTSAPIPSVGAKPKTAVTVDSKPPPPMQVTKPAGVTKIINRTSYQFSAPKGTTMSASSSPPREIMKPPPPYTNIPVVHMPPQQQPLQSKPQQQQKQLPQQQIGNIPSQNYQRERISPVPTITAPTPPHVTYKMMSSPRRSPVQQDELDYYKQRLLPQEAPPPYSALHSYEYYKKLPGARRNSTGGLMLSTSHLGAGRGFTFSIGGGPGGAGQINVVFSQNEGDVQPTQVEFQIPSGSPSNQQPSEFTYSVSPRGGSPGLAINYQTSPHQRDSLPPPPQQRQSYHKPGQSFDESKIIQISYPPNSSPQRSASSSPRPHGRQDYYTMRHPQEQQQQQQRPLFVRTDSPLMRTSSPRSSMGSGPPMGSTTSRGSPYLSPPQPSQHSMSYGSPGATASLYGDTTALTQSRSFKNLENKFIQGGNIPEPHPTTSHGVSGSWDDSRRSVSSGVSLRVNQNEVPQPVASARTYIPEPSPVGPSSSIPPHAYLAPPDSSPFHAPGNHHPVTRNVPANMDVYALTRADVDNMPPGLFAFFDKSFSERFLRWQNQRPPGFQSETLRLVKEMDQEQKHYDGAPYQ